MLLLLLAAFIGELATPSARDDWYWLQQFGQTTIISLMLVRVVDAPSRLKIAATVAVCSIGFHVTKQGLVSILSPGLRLVEGVGGSFGDNNSYAVICSMVAMLFLAAPRMDWPRWVRMGCVAAGVLSLLTVVSTYSRGGFFAAATGLLVYALLRRLRVTWLLGAAAVAAIVLTVTSLPSGYTDRLKTVQTYQEDASASGRLHFWEVALRMSLDQPFGVGVQNFNQVYDRYNFSDGEFGSSRSVHNSHLQVLTEAGFLGFAVWTFLFVYTFAIGFRIRRRSRQMPNGHLYTGLAEGLIAAFAAFIVGATFTAIAWNDFVICMIAFMAATDRVSLSAVEHRPATAHAVSNRLQNDRTTPVLQGPFWPCCSRA